MAEGIFVLIKLNRGFAYERKCEDALLNRKIQCCWLGNFLKKVVLSFQTASCPQKASLFVTLSFPQGCVH